jgi:hypothetical protein
MNSKKVIEGSLRNILLVELGNDKWTSEIVKNLSKQSDLQVFGTGTKSPGADNKFSNFLVRGNPHESGLDLADDIKNFVVDKNLYAEIKCFEGATLRMLDRVDGFRLWQRNDLSKRRNYFFREASFWANYLEVNQIKAVVFANVPHEVHDFIIYNLCIARKIPTLLFFHTFNVDSFAFSVSETVEGVGSPSLAKAIKLQIESVEPLGFKLRLSDDLLGTKNHGSNQFFGVYQGSTKQDKDAIDKPVLARAEKTSTQMRITSKLSRMRSKLQYLLKEKSNSLPKDFVYFPLHVEPELAVSPLGGHFEEQFEAVRFIASKLPRGWKVVIKEHPHQSGFGPRPKGFYKRFDSIPCVELVKTEFNSLELISKSQVVATITGSAGFEALRLGKPSWVLGYPWYLSAPGVSQIDSSADLEQAYAALKFFEPTTDDMLSKYVDLLHDTNFYGFIPGTPYHSPADEREFVHQATTQNVVAVINKWMLNILRD